MAARQWELGTCECLHRTDGKEFDVVWMCVSMWNVCVCVCVKDRMGNDAKIYT